MTRSFIILWFNWYPIKSWLVYYKKFTWSLTFWRDEMPTSPPWPVLGARRSEPVCVPAWSGWVLPAGRWDCPCHRPNAQRWAPETRKCVRPYSHRTEPHSNPVHKHKVIYNLTLCVSTRVLLYYDVEAQLECNIVLVKYRAEGEERWICQLWQEVHTNLLGEL